MILLIISFIILCLTVVLVFDLRRTARKLSKQDIKQTHRDTWILSLGMIATTLFTILVAKTFGTNHFSQETGWMGDTIGGVTAPLINGVAAILVYLALKAQIEANKQIQEQFTKQEKSDLRRDFESSFFQLIKIHNQNVNNIDFKLKLIFDNQLSEDGRKLFAITERMRNVEKKELLISDYDERITGKDVFKETYLFFDYMLTDVLAEEISESEYERMKKIYAFFYEKLDADYGHYFRGLYRIFKVLDECEPFSKDDVENYKIKYHYSSIVRSQLSDYEIYWLFYNCIFDYGIERFKPLIEKYSLLKILQHNNKPNIVAFKHKYAPSAFEKSKELN